MLWLGLYFPDLSVQIAAGMSATLPTMPALAIQDGPAQRPQVHAVNALARHSGVRCGMTITAAQALNGDLRILPRQPAAEAAAIVTLAAWAGQFTPAIVIEPAQGLLLEVAGSLTLFKGLTNLLGLLRRGLRALGYHAGCGVAPTARAAWLLAKANALGNRYRSCTQRIELPACLAAVPLSCCEWPADTLNSLHALGITTVGQLRALPRAGLQRRFGADIIQFMAQLFGELPDPRPWYVAPDTYRVRHEFMQAVTQVEALLFTLKRLLLGLEGFLRARDAGVQQLRLAFTYDNRAQATSHLTIGLLAPQREAARLLVLTREHLERTPPHEPVLALGLEVDTLLPYQPLNHTLLPDTHQQAVDWRQLYERLQARLGADKLFILQAGNDHRPELATVLVAAHAPAQSTPRMPLHPLPRPCWLLPEPKPLVVRDAQPHYRGALTLCAGPERLETGWWDGQRVNRDYYRARNAASETVWIYREHRTPPAWFLHGVFA